MATGAGAIDRSFLSTVSFSNTLERRDILKSVIDLYDEETNIMDIMDWTGKTKPADQTEFFHVTNDFLYASAQVKTNAAAGAAGASVSITILASAGVTPVKSELVLFPNGAVGYVAAISADSDPVLTIKPVNSGDSIPAVTAGDKLTFFSNAYAEGTGTNKMRKSNLLKRSNKLQIFKTSTEITDIAHGSKIEVDFKGKPYYFLKQQADAFLKHRMDIAYAMIFGRESNGLTDENGKPVHTTRGLRDSIVNGGGISSATTTANTITLDDLKALSRLMDASRCPSEYMLWAGADFDNEFDSDLTAITQFVNGGIQYGAFGGSKEKALALGIDSLKVFGRTFHKKRLSALSHPQVTAAAGYTQFVDEAYLIPMNKIKTEQGGGLVDRMMVRYLEFPDNAINGRFRERMTGGLAPVPTSDEDVLRISYVSTEGLQIVGAEHFVKYEI